MKIAAICLALSIAALPAAVNAQPQTLSSFNSDKADKAAGRQAPIKKDHLDISRLINIVLHNGQEARISPAVASSIGPATKTPLAVKDVVEKDHICTVPQKPDCFYLRTRKRSGLNLESRYFRVGLDGRLEKAYALHGVDDLAGHPASASESYPDIHSPAIQREFQAELDFWLKEWLPKQKAAAGKAGKMGGRAARPQVKRGARPEAPEAK